MASLTAVILMVVNQMATNPRCSDDEMDAWNDFVVVTNLVCWSASVVIKSC